MGSEGETVVIRPTQLPFQLQPRPTSSGLAADRHVDQAEATGAEFYERKRFHLPWSEPTRPLEGREVIEKLPSGRVEVTSPLLRAPIRLSRIDEIESLAALQTDQGEKARAVNGLAREGWRFQNQVGAEVDAYQAYQGQVWAFRDGVRLALADPVAAWNFYHAPEPAPGAQLEAMGYRFYHGEEGVAAFHAPACALVGRREGWLRLDQLPPGEEQAELARFERYLGMAGDLGLARLAFEAEPGSLTRLLEQGVPTHLALEAGSPPDDEIWKLLPTLPTEVAQEALRRQADRSPAARLALDLALAVPPRERKALWQRFSREVPDPLDPEALGELAQSLGRGAYQDVLLRHLLGRASDSSLVAAQALRAESPELRQRALQELARRRECQGLATAWRRWSGGLKNEASRNLAQTELFSRPFEPDGPARDRAMLARLPIAERPRLAAACVRSHQQDDDQSLIASGLLALEANSPESAREALLALAQKPGFEGLGSRLSAWEIPLESPASRALLYCVLLQHPLESPRRQAELLTASLEAELAALKAGPDPRHRFASRGRTQPREAPDRPIVRSEDLRSFAVAWLREEMQHPEEAEAIARQALSLLGKDTRAVDEALDLLQKSSPGLASRLALWQPSKRSPTAGAIMRHKLLGQPLAGDDATTRARANRDVLVQLMGSRQFQVEEAQTLAREFLDEAARDSSLAEIELEATTRLALQLGASAQPALQRLGLGDVALDWHWAGMSPTACAVVGTVLLENRSAAVDPANLGRLAEEVMAGLPRSERERFRERVDNPERARLRRMLAPERGTGVVQQDDWVIVGGVRVRARESRSPGEGAQIS